MIKTIKDPNGNNHDIEIDDDLDWLAPYLTEAKKAGIPVWRIRKILGYSVPEGKAQQQWAAAHKERNKKGIITILKYHQKLTGDGNVLYVDGYIRADEGHMFELTLNSLAHEFAHLVEWQHNAERFILESKLMVRFARLAKRRGYKGYGKYCN